MRAGLGGSRKTALQVTFQLPMLTATIFSAVPNRPLSRVAENGARSRRKDYGTKGAATQVHAGRSTLEGIFQQPATDLLAFREPQKKCGRASSEGWAGDAVVPPTTYRLG